MSSLVGARFIVPFLVAACQHNSRQVGFLSSDWSLIVRAFVGTNPLGELITSRLPVILPQWTTANRERQGVLTESRTTIARDPFYRELLCGAGQGCRRRILERLYIDHCLPLTVELFRQLAFFTLSCKPISYCRLERIDVYIL